MADIINHPEHYETALPGVETIDMIYAILGHEGFCAYCRGNVLKYISRAGKKGDTVEDLRKARRYIEFEIERREGTVDGEDG